MAATTEEKAGFFEKNQKVIVIAGLVILGALLLMPDAIIKKYVPWVK